MTAAVRRACAVLLVLGLGLMPRVSHAKLMLIAHRGASPTTAENTLGAFNCAKEVADFVEYDVHSTKDGELVVIHDSTVDRTTNGKGAVADLTLAEIRQLDAGSWAGPASAGEKIPTAEETIAAIQTEAAPFMERKAGTVEQFVALLNRQPLRPEGIVMSTDFDFIAALKAARPEVQVGWIGSGTLTAAQIARAVAAGVSHFVWEATGIESTTAQSVHQAGGLVFAWTVDDLARATTLSDWGVDGIITNRSADFATTPTFACPFSTDQPHQLGQMVVRQGASAMLTAAAPPHAAKRVVWRRAGSSHVIGTGGHLLVNTAATANFGQYVASWVDNGVAMTSNAEVAPGAADNQLVNISARMTIGAGEDVGIVGFVVKSGRAPRFLLRAIGPSLAQFGITDFIPAPALTLYRKGTVIDSATVGQRTYATAVDCARNGAFSVTPSAGDVAILRNLEGGLYSAHLSASDGKPGMGMIEVYQDNTPANFADGAPINLSVRGRVLPESPVIAGFVVPDGSSQTMLVRGIGPSLAKLGITDPLRDPMIRIYSKGTVVAENDDWWSDGDSAVVAAVSAQFGAFHVNGGRDAAVLVTLPPGAYTAILRDGDPSHSGVGLLEIYAVDLDQVSR